MKRHFRARMTCASLPGAVLVSVLLVFHLPSAACAQVPVIGDHLPEAMPITSSRLASSGFEEKARSSRTPLSTPISAVYAQRPLQFEVNQGQAAPGIDFLSYGPGYRFFLKATGATLTLQKPPAPGEASVASDKRFARSSIAHRRFGRPQSKPESVTIHLQLVGANPAAVVSGLQTLPGRVNYVVGQDAAKWHTNIPTYARAKYVNVYPGVALIYYGTNQRQLEYDFQIAPGGDPETIRLKFDGVDAIEVDAAGDLVLHAAGGVLRQRRPFIYQEVAGVRQPVAGGYVRKDEREIGFWVGRYDASRPLVIDPVITYATYLGGIGEDAGNDIAVDTAGNIYVVGTTNSLGRSDADVFVRKFGPSGSPLLYETYLDSNGTDDAGYGIAVDAAGNAYATGQFGSPLLPGFALGVLVAKLSPQGAPFYQVTFGANSPGFSMDFGSKIAVDEAGNAYVVGTTFGLGTPFPTTAGAFQELFGRGFCDAFVVKLNPSGAFVYATLLGGIGDDYGLGIAIRKVGTAYHAYVTGKTALVGDFPTTPGAFQTTFGGAADAFVTQFNATGSALVYSTYLGGKGGDEGYAIDVDAVGNAYLTGRVGESDDGSLNTFPVLNAFQPTYGGAGGGTPAGANAFVTKLNPTGSALVYSSYMGGGGFNQSDEARAIKVDGEGFAYLTGSTSTHIPDIFTGDRFPIVNAFQPEPGGGFSSPHPDAFVTKLTPQGALVYSSYLGGNYWDEGNGIDVNGLGNVYVTGMTMSSDFPITPDAFQRVIGGGGCSYPFSCPDAFVTKIYDHFNLFVIKNTTGNTVAVFDDAGNIVIKGVLEQNSTHESNAYAFAIKNNRRSALMIDHDGKMYIAGNMHEQQDPFPVSNNENDFWIHDADGNAVALVTPSGSVYLKGRCVEQGNP